jgi:hypothetical protein
VNVGRAAKGVVQHGMCGFGGWWCIRVQALFGRLWGQAAVAWLDCERAGSCWLLRWGGFLLSWGGVTVPVEAGKHLLAAHMYVDVNLRMLMLMDVCLCGCAAARRGACLSRCQQLRA